MIKRMSSLKEKLYGNKSIEEPEKAKESKSKVGETEAEKPKSNKY